MYIQGPQGPPANSHPPPPTFPGADPANSKPPGIPHAKVKLPVTGAVTSTSRGRAGVNPRTNTPTPPHHPSHTSTYTYTQHKGAPSTNDTSPRAYSDSQQTMSGTDPQDSGKRSNSRTRSMSRPTTPLRPSSRSSFRESAQRSVDGAEPFPLNTFEPAFAELSDAVADLEANMMHFQLMHESLSRFSESFASFLYGLNMNAFCVDFPEGPIAESFRRAKQKQSEEQAEAPVRSRSTERADLDSENTFMTTDFSFVENPSTASKPTPKKFATPETRQSRLPSAPRGTTRGRAGTGRGRASGLVKPRVRGIR
ncbi:hypothetical protein JX266_006193 [Neoarthrinium moseri]|nr:hypothetical protein JX266_006193 [Neoarthrinium moseri]